jgi:hypothetical protein
VYEAEQMSATLLEEYAALEKSGSIIKTRNIDGSSISLQNKQRRKSNIAVEKFMDADTALSHPVQLFPAF